MEPSGTQEERSEEHDMQPSKKTLQDQSEGGILKQSDFGTVVNQKR